jgi:hypothetical protein
LLRVDDQHAGKHAACPACRTVHVVSGPSSAAIADVAGGARWSLQTPEGHVYGPVGKGELDRWLTEGRITADCQLRAGDDGPWRSADQCYPVLRPASAGPEAAVATDRAVAGAPQAGQVIPPAFRAASEAGRYLVPHRGGLILTLGILSWVSCPVFGVMAWVMGTSDLREIRVGRMNPGGAGLTQAGRVLGMISTLVWLAWLVLGFFVMILMTALRVVG